MSFINSQRSGCKDVFNAFLVSHSTYDGDYEIPVIKPCYETPNKMISFSKSIASKDYDQWVHFYEDDFLFERIWRNPEKYLETLKKYKGVILPDFSLYRDMPLCMQIWNIYRSRAIGSWLQQNGVNVIPNIRYGDERTYDISCNGVSKHSVIAVGSHGTFKNLINRKLFLDGLDYVVNKLKPTTIVIYGNASDKYFEKYKKQGINIVRFDSAIAISHREVV